MSQGIQHYVLPCTYSLSVVPLAHPPPYCENIQICICVPGACSHFISIWVGTQVSPAVIKTVVAFTNLNSCVLSSIPVLIIHRICSYLILIKFGSNLSPQRSFQTNSLSCAVILFICESSLRRMSSL